jgi:hypothetical protein
VGESVIGGRFFSDAADLKRRVVALVRFFENMPFDVDGYGVLLVGGDDGAMV